MKKHHPLLEDWLAEQDEWYRSGEGRPCHVMDLVREFPDLGDDPLSCERLFWNEFKHRKRRGDLVAIREMTAGFPARYGVELEKRLRRLIRKLGSVPHLNDGSQDGGRFRILGVLGYGEWGVVYHARDETGLDSALKTLRRKHQDDPRAREWFLREARILSSLKHHPGLVQLFRIFDRPVPFFTMELVPGLDFLEHLRREDFPGRKPNIEQVERVRKSLLKLCEAVAALHAQDYWHSDLKPNNVRVTPDEDRVVLLDVGQATRRPESQGKGSTRILAGAIPYLSPQQISFNKPTAACDVYALGAIAFESLTGQRPFEGSDNQIAKAKLSGFPPPRPSERRPGIPDDLDRLCEAMLQPDPAARPSLADVRKALSPVTTPFRMNGIALPAPDLMQRPQELEALFAAYERARTRPVVVGVEAEPGFGQSTLLKSLALRLSDEERALVLRSSCNAQEAGPSRGVGELLSGLRTALNGMNKVEIASIQPTDVGSLMERFSVFRLVMGFDKKPTDLDRRRIDAPYDPAVQALGELLSNLGSPEKVQVPRTPVLLIDNAQCLDSPGAGLLRDLIRSEKPPALLLVLAFRPGDLNHSTAIREILTHDSEILRLKPLDAPVSRRLAEQWLHADGSDPDLVAHLVRQSRGIPLLLRWLADDAVQKREKPAGTLGEVIRRRLDSLPQGAGNLLEVLCVRGGPIPLERALTAAGIPIHQRWRVLKPLIDNQWAYTGDADGWIEPPHRLIARVVRGRLGMRGFQEVCLKIAVALARGRQAADFPMVARLFLRADQRAKAAEYFERAGDVAMKGILPDRPLAVRYFRSALRLQTGEQPARQRAVRIKCANALAEVGRSAEAAVAYLRAARGTTITETAQLRRSAAHQFWLSGDLRRARALQRLALDDLGPEFPRTPMSATWARWTGWFMLALRSLRPNTASNAFDDRTTADQVDARWISLGLGLGDFDRMEVLENACLRMALRSGDAYRSARALAIQAVFRAARGASSRSTNRLLKAARDLDGSLTLRAGPRAAGQRIHAQAVAKLATGIAAYFDGRWDEALGTCDSASESLSKLDSPRSFSLDDLSIPAFWEPIAARAFALASLVARGDFRELSRRLTALPDQSNLRGNRLERAWFGLPAVALALARAEPEQARAALAASRATGAQGVGHLPLHSLTVGEAWARLFEAATIQQPAKALAVISAAKSALDARAEAYEKSGLLRIRLFRVELTALRAGTDLTLMALGGPTTGEDLAGLVRQAIRSLLAERIPLADALGWTLQAAMTRAPGRAAELLERASSIFDQLGMALHAAISECRRGQILADALLVGQATRRLESLGVLPTAIPGLMGALTPGFPRASFTVDETLGVGSAKR